MYLLYIIFVLVSKSALDFSYTHNCFCWYHPVSEKTNFLSVVIYVFGLCWRTRLCRVKRYWLFIFFVFNRNKKWKMQHLLYQTILPCFSVLLFDVFLDAFNQYWKMGDCILHTATCLLNLGLSLYTNWYIKENYLTYIQ